MADDTKASVPLRCLHGEASPEGMAEDLAALLALPEEAQKEFWQVLGAYLAPDLDEEGQRVIVNYSTRHDVTSPQLSPAVKATRFLFQATARAGLGVDDLREDLEALDEEHAPALIALLAPWFEDFAPRLRAMVAHEAIADHGKLVTSTRWRIDKVVNSDRGRGVSAAVAVVTFRYREGDKDDRITLHLLPDDVAALRDAASEMLR